MPATKKAEPKTKAVTEPKADAEELMAYCVKCKKTQVMNEGKETKTKNGRRMMKGVCAACGTVMCKFLPNK